MVFAAGFCIIGGQIGLNALAASTYPSSIRSTGIGSALAVGRLGSVAGPVVGGALLAQGADLRSLFLVAALPAVIAALAMLVLRWARHPAGATVLPHLKEAPS